MALVSSCEPFLSTRKLPRHIATLKCSNVLVMHHGKGDHQQHRGSAALTISRNRKTDNKDELYILNLATFPSAMG